ncbi:MAG: HK97 family phage prohead protease [Gammaproteobacteria bacterium]|nr:HK97 family phage prohead protease [Gammaproteobacteria bacterium]
MRSERRLEPERRFVAFRASEAGVSGVALRYGDVARFGDYGERFEPGSLRIGPDLVANVMHDRRKPVARTDAGLFIEAAPDQVSARIDWPATSFAREARELVEARILRGFSIEFLARRERFEARTRIIEDAELVGLALVDRPAYPESVIAARMADLASGETAGAIAAGRTPRRRELV